MGFAYLIINILVSIFPIIWRFRIYFDISYLIILAAFIKEFEIPRLKCFSKWMSIAVICVISRTQKAMEISIQKLNYET